jgi:diacylglycerol kinase (ATP)
MITVIINPVSGSAGRAGIGAARAEIARRALSAAGVDGDVFVTEGPCHAAALASAAVQRGATTVAAWGGDGTVNEVGRALVGSRAALAVVPAGSGNGFARALRVTLDPHQALGIAIRGVTRPIDVGVLNGSFFFNIAGIGFDAHVARRFNETAAGRRGLLPYLKIATIAGLRYRSQWYRVTVRAEAAGGPSEVFETRALVLALANAPQYGYGATIAPEARVDDGAIDLVVVKSRFLPVDVWRARRLFNGTFAADRHVAFRTFQTLRIEGDAPLEAHADGEFVDAGNVVDVTVRPAALLVKAPGH